MARCQKLRNVGVYVFELCLLTENDSLRVIQEKNVLPVPVRLRCHNGFIVSSVVHHSWLRQGMSDCLHTPVGALLINS